MAGGLGLTARLGFNPGELADFIVGWFGSDLYDDDGEWRELKTRAPATAPASKIPGYSALSWKASSATVALSEDAAYHTACRAPGTSCLILQNL